MKRLLALCLLLTLLCSACASAPQSSAQSPLKLSLWHYYNGPSKDVFDSLVQRYNETVGNKNGILIDATAFSGVDALAEAVASSAKGEVGAPPLPDIFAAYPDTLYPLHIQGLVAALDPYFTKQELALYQADFLESGRFGADNHLHILPIAKSSELFYLNETDFAPFATACGVSLESLHTWEGISDAAKRYYEWTDAKTPAPNDGQAFFGIDSFANFFLISTRQLGGELYAQKDGKMEVSFDSATAKRIWDTLYAPYLSGHFASIGRFRSDDTKAGDLIAYVASTASANYFPKQVETGKDAFRPIEAKVLPYPVFADGTPVVVQQGAGLALTEGDESRKKAASDFLKWFTLPEQNSTFALSTGYIPVQNDALSEETLLAALEAQPDADPSSPVFQTTVSSGVLIRDYSLYAGKPFAGSYAARKLLDSTLLSRLAADTASLDARLATGEDRNTALAALLSPEAFDSWYQDFMQEMTVIVNEE